MKAENMKSSNGKSVPNQFIITEKGCGVLGNFKERKTLRSYDTVIAIVTEWEGVTRIELDRDRWDYSGKYRNQFLGETKKETEAKITSGEYILTDLNFNIHI